LRRSRTAASYYRAFAGAQIDLVLVLSARKLWAIGIKRSLDPRPRKHGWTDPFSIDHHLDPPRVWAGKAEHPSLEGRTVSLHVHVRFRMDCPLDAAPMK
jgi:hypothetical protein